MLTRAIIILSLACLTTVLANAAPVSCVLAEPTGCSPTATRQVLAHARTMGMVTVRIRADWLRIQPRKGQWNFAWLDTLVADARQAGLHVILVLGPAPAWAVSYLDDPSPEELARAHPDQTALVTYATKVAQHYGRKVDAYQVWEKSSAAALLALPEDVAALFQSATAAIHRVDPTLRVLIPEPGDVDLCWITNYLASARGTAMPDILLLSPTRSTLRPEVFWWRVPALRTHVLSKYPALAVWAAIPISAAQSSTGVTAATAALLDRLPTVIFTPDTQTDLDAPKLTTGMRTFATLQGANYAGWALLGQDVPAGIFQTPKGTAVLALPLDDIRIPLVQSKLPALTGLAVPDAHATITPVGAKGSTIAAKQEWQTGNVPTLLTGVAVKPMPGTPDVLLATACGQEVSLDLAGDDTAGIHLLPDLPGGAFIRETEHGRSIVRTVRGKSPWIHVDVPDGFLFFNTQRIPLEVTIDVFGVTQAQRTGFNLYYDAQQDMRYTPWQWIDVGPDKVYSYTFKLTDALFANRAGYDFRINMGGSVEEIRVVDIRVKKLIVP